MSVKTIRSRGTAIGILLLLLISGVSVVRGVQLENKIEQLSSSYEERITYLDNSYTGLLQEFSSLSEDYVEAVNEYNTQGERGRYTGNPFTTQLWPGQLQAENITGMHWYTEIGGNLYNRSDTIIFPESAATYIMFNDSGIVYAKNGTTGQIDFRGAVDASLVIQQAIDALPAEGGRILFKEGLFQTFLPINITDRSDVAIDGQFESTIIEAQTNNFEIFNVSTSTGYEYNIRFRGLKIRCAEGLTPVLGNYGIYLTGGDYSYHHIFVEECYFRNLYDAAYFGQRVYGLWWVNSPFRDIYRNGIIAEYGNDFHVYGVTADNEKAGLVNVGAAFNLTDNGGFYVESVDILHFKYGVYAVPAAGAANPTALYMTNFYFDLILDTGIYVDGTAHSHDVIYLTNGWINDVGTGECIYIKDSDAIKIHHCRLTNPTTEVIDIDGCMSVSIIDNNIAGKAGQDVVLITDSTKIWINDNDIGGSGVDGIELSGTTDMVYITNNDFSSLTETGEEINDACTGTVKFIMFNNPADSTEIPLDPAPGIDHTGSGWSVRDTVGENVAIGDVLYMKNDGKWWKADADGAATMPGAGLAMQAVLADNDCKILLYGIFRDDTWNYALGSLLYVSTAPGPPTTTRPVGAGDIWQSVGIVITADIILFNPCYNATV